MTQINLLPWRERVRRTQKIYFGFLLGSSIFLSFIFIFAVHTYYKIKIDKQNNSNTYIQSELNKENQLLATIESKMKEYTTIQSQLKFSVQLRKENYNAIRMLKELAIIVPNTILITKLERNGATLTLSGQAITNSDLTHFMQNIDDSSVFDKPELSQISSNKESKNGNFEISIHETL